MRRIQALGAFILLLHSSCNKPPRCEQPMFVQQSEIVVTFMEKSTGRYLYSEIHPLYNKDSLKVFDQYGNSLVILSLSNLIPNTSDGYNVLSFGNIYDSKTDASAFNSELCKTYLIRYSSSEADTVQTCFKAKNTRCGSTFETLKVYHRGQILASVENKTSAQITLLKD